MELLLQLSAQSVPFGEFRDGIGMRFYLQMEKLQILWQCLYEDL